jgi:riboflavin kinase/FMN adenylyltransferase
MRILSPDESLPSGQTSVVTVGNFDGVHLGHRKLLCEVVSRARNEGRTGVAVTFEPHTRLVAAGETGYNQLTTFEEKARLIELSGVENLLCVPFTTGISRQEPETFVQEVLVGRLHMAEWVMGRGHAIGRNRSGDQKFLHEMQGKYHFITFVADLLTRNGTTVSSTQVREAVTSGRIAEAVEMLGHPYLLAVERIEGKKIGAKLGYPTLNFKSPPSRKVIPPPGVYAAELEFRGIIEQGALYFGECPTLRERREVHFEFYSLHRGKEEVAPGENAHLWLYSFIRRDRAFDSTGELVGRIAQDVETAKTFFNKEKVQWR